MRTSARRVKLADGLVSLFESQQLCAEHLDDQESHVHEQTSVRKHRAPSFMLQLEQRDEQSQTWTSMKKLSVRVQLWFNTTTPTIQSHFKKSGNNWPVLKILHTRVDHLVVKVEACTITCSSSSHSSLWMFLRQDGLRQQHRTTGQSRA